MDEAGVHRLVNAIVKDAPMPADVINHHVSRLRGSLGMTSGQQQRLSERNLKHVASAAARPRDFLEAYDEASAAGTPGLEPMVAILHEINADPDLRRHFKGSGDQHDRGDGGKTDLTALKEKLLQQVGHMASTDGTGPGGLGGLGPLGRGPGRGERAFPARPHLTLDFLPEELLAAGADGAVVGELGRLPVASQESAVIEDLLYLFVGVEGTHIKPRAPEAPTRRGHRSAGKAPAGVDSLGLQVVPFAVDDTLDPSLRELLDRILPLCSRYSTVARFAEANELMEAGRVNQALAGAYQDLLGDYLVFVAQLETQFRAGDLTLNKVWFYVQPTLRTMTLLATTAETVAKLGARGGRTLSLLHEKLREARSGGSEAEAAVAAHLARSAAKPFFRTLARWVHTGVIDDPGRDFFVEDNEVVERSALPLEYSDDYWERRYSIRAEQIPAFLHAHADMILRTGKYLNVIQQCDKALDEDEKGDEDFLEKEEDVVYMANPEQYLKPLEKAHELASKTLLELLVKDRDLIGHLRSVKHYFLLDQGDFITQFLDLCEPELSQNVNQVEPARLESLLELAQRTSAAAGDPYKDAVCVELLPYDLLFQMCKILSIDTEEEAEFHTFAATSELTGMEAFAFGYDVQWPISLVLNRKSLACYQMLLR